MKYGRNFFSFSAWIFCQKQKEKKVENEATLEENISVINYYDYCALLSQNLCSIVHYSSVVCLLACAFHISKRHSTVCHFSPFVLILYTLCVIFHLEFHEYTRSSSWSSFPLHVYCPLVLHLCAHNDLQRTSCCLFCVVCVFNAFHIDARLATLITMPARPGQVFLFFFFLLLLLLPLYKHIYIYLLCTMISMMNIYIEKERYVHERREKCVEFGKSPRILYILWTNERIRVYVNVDVLACGTKRIFIISRARKNSCMCVCVKSVNK